MIKYFFTKVLSPTKIKDATLRKTASSYTTAKTRVVNLKGCRTNTQNAERSGRPKFATTEKVVKNSTKAL